MNAGFIAGCSGLREKFGFITKIKSVSGVLPFSKLSAEFALSESKEQERPVANR